MKDSVHGYSAQIVDPSLTFLLDIRCSIRRLRYLNIRCYAGNQINHAVTSNTYLIL